MRGIELMRDWNFEGQIVRAIRIAGFLLVFFCLTLVFKPHDPIMWGFVVGTSVSMWNTFFLAKRLSRITGVLRGAAVEVAKARVVGGFAIRMFTNLAVLFLIARTGWANIYATAAGLFIVPCIFTFIAAANSFREARGADPLK